MPTMYLKSPRSQASNEHGPPHTTTTQSGHTLVLDTNNKPTRQHAMLMDNFLQRKACQTFRKAWFLHETQAEHN